MFKSITQWIWFCKSNDSSFFNTILNSILILKISSQVINYQIFLGKMFRKVYIMIKTLCSLNSHDQFIRTKCLKLISEAFWIFLKSRYSWTHSGLIYILHVPSFSFCSIFESVIHRIYIRRVVGGEKHYGKGLFSLILLFISSFFVIAV